MGSPWVWAIIRMDEPLAVGRRAWSRLLGGEAEGRSGREWNFSRWRVLAGGLLLAGLLACLIFLFSLLGRLIEGRWRVFIHPLDEAAAFWAHSLTSPGMDVPMWSLSWIGEPSQMAVGLICLLLYLFWRRRYFSALCVLLVMPGTGVMKKLTGSFVQRQRPNYWFQHDPSDLGYPAGDVMNAVVLTGLCLFLVWPRLRVGWQRAAWALGGFLVVFGTGFSRLYVSAHWLTDNLAGFLMGAIWVSFAVPVIRWMFPRCRDGLRPSGVGSNGVPTSQQEPRGTGRPPGVDPSLCRRDAF